MQKNIKSDDLNKNTATVQDGLTDKFNEQSMMMSFAARLLGAFADRKLLINIAMETIANLSKSKRVAVLMLENENKNLRVEGLFLNHKPYPKDRVLSCEDSFTKQVLSMKVPRFYQLKLDGKVPMPSDSDDNTAKRCLCLPLVDSSFEVIGIASIEMPKKSNIGIIELQKLYTYSTLFSLSLQNAVLFSKILYDGLTGLFVRKYYEVRIAEELLKLKRHPGSIAIVLIDIDHFKTINDKYGHKTGDLVLVEFSNILKENVRKGTSIVCRYEGEKFIIMMSDTPLKGALIVADRISSLCRNYKFAGAQNLQVTVSAGLAFTDGEELISAEELYERANAMLNKAKKNGGNQTMVWSDSNF